MTRSTHSKSVLCLSLIGLSLFAGRAEAQWQMKQGPLMTRWAADVKPDAVLPEYPRPQMTRPDWMNLNGVWQYQPGRDGDATPAGQKLSSEILVPFCVESALSGVMEHHDRLWYRRTFTLPATFAGKRAILHFGAVDYESEVYVNGKSVGVHKGGYDTFSYDVTDALTGTGEQELIVRVFDPTNKGGQPRGKQSLRPGGIMYTSVTGIWQTVWMEPVQAGGIERLRIVPDVDGGRVTVAADLLGGATGGDVTVTVKDGGSVIGVATGKPGTPIAVNVQNPQLWSPDSPHLYDLDVKVADGDKAVDSVGSYFGMRKISLGEDNGVKKILLNDKFTFLIGPLDQGFWPDGIYTQPTEEALKYDIQATKDLGFNFIRKHIKVEPMRWYYWCDKLGLMVWQDMPSANSYDDRPTPPVDKPEYKSELTRMVENLSSVPSIVQWEIFNENQGAHDQGGLVDLVRKLDPTRLIDEDSGGDMKGNGDLFDTHPYPAPNVPRPNAKQAIVNGEYGGIGFEVPGHVWTKRDNHAYTDVHTPQDLIDLYAEFTARLKGFRDNNGMSAAVYTQTTDVETEINGLLTYDRVPKMDVKQIARANHFELAGPTYTPVVATSETESQTWRYTFDKPAGDDWSKTDFDAAGWTEGPGGFGTEATPGIGKLGTVWNGSDVWMRRTFDVGSLTPEQIGKLQVRVYHDEDVTVYVNGEKAFEARGHNGHYENKSMSEAARKAIKPGAGNVLAVHCHQTVFGQYVDVGLTLREPAK